MSRDTVAIVTTKLISGACPLGAAVLITGVFTACHPRVCVPAANATVASFVAGQFEGNASTRIAHEFRGAAPLCSCGSCCRDGGAGGSAPLLIALVPAVISPFATVLIIVAHPDLSDASSTGTPGWRGNRLQ